MTEEKDVTALVVQLLSGNGTPRPIKGNQLSVVVKTYFPDFDPRNSTAAICAISSGNMLLMM